MDVISERFKAWLKLKGWSFRDIAERLDVSPSLPCEWSKGNGTPGRDLAIRLEDLSEGSLAAEAWSKDPAVHASARANARRRARDARRIRSAKCTDEVANVEAPRTFPVAGGSGS